MEHVDHGPERDKDDDDAAKLCVLDASYHGRLHASVFDIAEARGEDGRFQELEVPRWPPTEALRWKAVIGAGAEEAAAEDGVTL